MIVFTLFAFFFFAQSLQAAVLYTQPIHDTQSVIPVLRKYPAQSNVIVNVSTPVTIKSIAVFISENYCGSIQLLDTTTKIFSSQFNQQGPNDSYNPREVLYINPEGFNLTEGHSYDLIFGCNARDGTWNGSFVDNYGGAASSAGSSDLAGNFVANAEVADYSFAICDSIDCSLEETEKPLSFKAASLAKQVVNHPEAYLWSGKGWDYNLNEFVTPANLLSGYTYKKDTTGIGVDCSGLVMWTYNRSFDKNKPAFNNFVRAPNADEQYRYNTTPIGESQLQPGDVMFFDFDSTDGSNHIDHTAMYVGESGGYDVVNAADSNEGIVARSKDLLKNLSGFRDFRQVAPAHPLAMVITSHSPVDLIVTDPDRFSIGPDTIIPSETEYLREIPGVLYYSEMERGTDGNPVDQVYSYTEKIGDYNIKVIPNSGIPPESTFTLDFTKGSQTIILAQDLSISQIPAEGYGIAVSETGAVSSFILVKMDIMQDSINLKSNGVTPAVIFGSVVFDVKQIEPSSIKLAGAGIKLKNKGQPMISYEDINKDGFNDFVFHVTTKELKLSLNDTTADLEGKLINGEIIKGSDSVRIIK